MVDKNIQKVIIAQKDLPKIKNTGEYFFRYRIKDKTNTVYTDWSQKYTVSLTNSIASIISTTPINYKIYQLTNQDIVNLEWTMPSVLDINNFDVYIKWYTGNEPSLETQNNTPWTRYPKIITEKIFNVEIPLTNNWVQIAVLAESFPKFSGNIIDNETVFLFKTNLTKIPIPIDGGEI